MVVVSLLEVLACFDLFCVVLFDWVRFSSKNMKEKGGRKNEGYKCGWWWLILLRESELMGVLCCARGLACVHIVGACLVLVPCLFL